MKRRAILAHFLVGLALLVLISRWCADDEPEIAVEVGAGEIFIGESVDYVVEIRNAKSPAAPDLSALRGTFDVVANGDESRNQSSMTIIGGRISQESTLSHVYRYRLTPKRTGKIVIPAPSAKVDGKTISGCAIALSVIAPEEQDLVIPEIKTDRTRVYPTQPFEVRLRVLVRPLPDDQEHDPTIPLRRNPPNINVNWIDLPPGLRRGQVSMAPEACRRQWDRVHAQRPYHAKRIVLRRTAGSGVQLAAGGQPEGARRQGSQLLRLRAEAEAHSREGGNIHAWPGRCEGVLCGWNGLGTIPGPPPGGNWLPR